MQRVLWVAMILMLLAAAGARAQLIDTDLMPASTGEAADSAIAAKPAPGGGEMIVLGPESRYVTRAWRDHDGNMQCGCTREDAETAERVRIGAQEAR